MPVYEGMTDGERDLITGKIDKVEKDLKEDIEKITFPTLFGKWVSEHVALVGVGSMVTIVTFVGTLILGVFWVSDRFVEAAELDKAQQQIQRDISTLRYQNKSDSLEMRRWYVEQRLADLQAKRNLTPEDRVRADQMRRELDRIEVELRMTNEKVEKLQQPVAPTR